MMSAWNNKKGKTSKFVDAGIREKNINIMEWIDREEWRINIKIKLQAQKL